MPVVKEKRHAGQQLGKGSLRQGGLFVTFEGIEGSGKSTQCRALADQLRSRGLKVVETREPGGTPMAESIRRLFLQTPGKATDRLMPEAEALLILAARSQHVKTLLIPSLNEGAIVLCDRFSDSTLAYQGYGRGLPIKELEKLNRFASAGLTPDITFVFDLPVQEGLARRRRDPHQNRLDKEALAFHSRVRKGFLEIARQHPRRTTIINARRSEEDISQQIWDTIVPILQRRLKAQYISKSADLKGKRKNEFLNLKT